MNWIISFLSYLWHLLQLWINTLFVTPIQNKEMLWILVPIWLGWFFSEFFQEKTGTSMGNAISNSIVVFWGSIDWFRQTVRLIGERAIIGTWNIATRLTLAGVVLIYGTLIIILGLKGKKIIRRMGRIREVTYVFAMFTPIFYQAMPFSIDHVIATLLFFPVFYFTIELIDKYTPNPKAIEEDNAAINGGASSTAKSPSLSTPSPGFRAPNSSFSSPVSRNPNPGYGFPSNGTRGSPGTPGINPQRNQGYPPMRPRI